MKGRIVIEIGRGGGRGVLPVGADSCMDDGVIGREGSILRRNHRAWLARVIDPAGVAVGISRDCEADLVKGAVPLGLSPESYLMNKDTS